MKHWTPDDIADQTGSTALITGANSGFGLVTAREPAGNGARVILAGRRQSAHWRPSRPSATLPK